MDFFLHPKSMATIITFFIIALSILIFRVLARKLYQKQSKKRYHPVGGTIFNQLINFNRLHDYMTDLASKHKTYRLIGPFRSEVYTSDPANVEYILKTNFENYGKGWYNYSLIKDLLGDGIFAVDGEKWREQRKVSSLEFSARALRDVSSIIFRENAVKLANIVSEAAFAHRPMDIQELFMKSTLDSIFRVAFGVDLDSMCGSNEEGVRFSRAFDDASAITAWRYVDIMWKIKKALNIGLEAKLKENIRIIDEFVYKLIRSKIEQNEQSQNDCVESKKQDILTRFLKLSDADPKYLRDIILNFDPKMCFSDDTMPDGFQVKKGDTAAYQPYAMGRMSFIWGDDAEEYKPERWIDENGCFKPESPFKFTAFQAGPRICLGKEFAYRQMKIISAVLLRFFVFKLSDESKAVKYRTMINLHIDGGLSVRAIRRN
ncbi:cytochrome p450 704c1 [Phtheirospermum japonicum]|uniref:Cytochrome p450 704c1 n=1 Tax=Phtheirospermum japonicum TaxID=374723 RepID=A0A830BN98_9LAMI|nr:cytochrome p450 704c1 [Phtheirospermum japonicum]